MKNKIYTIIRSIPSSIELSIGDSFLYIMTYDIYRNGA